MQAMKRMTHTPPEAEVESYLRRFRRALISIPADIREDFVAELRSHMSDRLAAGASHPAESFGSPEEYAAELIREGALREAIDHARSLKAGILILRGAGGTALTAFTVFLLAIVELTGIILAVVGFAKPLAPNHIGVFLGRNRAFGGLGFLLDTSGLHEVLGYLAFPAFVLAGVLLVWPTHSLILRLARRQLLRLTEGRKNHNGSQGQRGVR